MVLQEEVFQKLFREAEIARFNETQHLSYRESLRDLWDSYSTWECANQEGMEKGMEKGLAKGRKEGRKANAIEIANKLKSLGMDVETILQVTGLTKEEIA